MRLLVAPENLGLAPATTSEYWKRFSQLKSIFQAVIFNQFGLLPVETFTNNVYGQIIRADFEKIEPFFNMVGMGQIGQSLHEYINNSWLLKFGNKTATPINKAFFETTCTHTCLFLSFSSSSFFFSIDICTVLPAVAILMGDQSILVSSLATYANQMGSLDISLMKSIISLLYNQYTGKQVRHVVNMLSCYVLTVL